MRRPRIALVSGEKFTLSGEKWVERVSGESERRE
jgi:hypothetical protein